MLRRAFILSGLAGLTSCGKRGGSGRSHPSASTGHALPISTRFRGAEKFHALCARSARENWAALPVGERTVRIARELIGTPYQNWTLEIDDHIEAPSANFLGLDCWTAYEIPLAFGRMIAEKPGPWDEEDLLRWIEKERYRNGRCDGTYLSRMHYLEEVFHDSEKRGLATNITADLPGAVRLQRRISDMTRGWSGYRYLRANPALVPGIDTMERRVSALQVWHVPKAGVPQIEPLLRPGDILAITGNGTTSYTTHVGLAVPQGDGTTRFLHATSDTGKGRRVVLDGRISAYLNERATHAGVIVCRPR